MIKKPRLVQLCVLLFVVAAVGLWAQDTVLQGIDRPLRSQDDYPHSSLLIPHSSFPTPSPIITEEALSQPLTEQYIRRYTSPSGIQWLNAVINNGSVYFEYIKEEIARRNLPPELAYLPFVESGFIGTARSRSGAVGIWQFMLNSVPSGMRINEMIDERRDFRKSTIAALNKFEENYRALGDWPLALAAYNAGLGGITRAVQRARTSDYWVICERKEIKTETIHYVPKLVAIAHILANSRKYGVDYWPQTVEWTTIRPVRQASLDVIAAETGTDRNLLYRLNHELLYGITPPDRDYELKVPLSQASMIAAILEREDIKLLLYYRYQVKYGDTLSALSRHYGVSLNLIEQHNPGILNRYLRIGETVIIPAFRETTPYDSGTGSPAPSLSPQATAGIPFTGTHVVERGDTLWSLAIRYRVDPQVLAAQNNMAFNDILSIGKVLKVPIIE